MSVPQWAYLDVTTIGGAFNVTDAQSEAAKNLPDITGSETGPESTTTNGASPVSTGTSPNGSPTAPPSTVANVPPSKKKHTGAIVGGVIGGTGGLAILGALLWFLLFRRKKRHAIAIPPATFSNAMSDDSVKFYVSFFLFLVDAPNRY